MERSFAESSGARSHCATTRSTVACIFPAKNAYPNSPKSPGSLWSMSQRTLCSSDVPASADCVSSTEKIALAALRPALSSIVAAGSPVQRRADHSNTSRASLRRSSRDAAAVFASWISLVSRFEPRVTNNATIATASEATPSNIGTTTLDIQSNHVGSGVMSRTLAGADLMDDRVEPSTHDGYERKPSLVACATRTFRPRGMRTDSAARASHVRAIDPGAVTARFRHG